jgi:WD40 repeat protein
VLHPQKKTKTNKKTKKKKILGRVRLSFIITIIITITITIIYIVPPQVLTLDASDLPTRCARFVPRQQWIVTGSDDLHVRVFHHATHEKVKAFEAHTDYIRCIAPHETQPWLLTSADDLQVRLWDWERGWQNLMVRGGVGSGKGREWWPLGIAWGLGLWGLAFGVAWWLGGLAFRGGLGAGILVLGAWDPSLGGLGSEPVWLGI